MQLDRQGWRLYYEKSGSRYDPLERRLMHEHLLLAALCESDADFSYKVIEAESSPPRAYRITFHNLRSIVSIDADMLPVLGDEHVMEVHLPSGYPVEAPVCYMVSATWHPNIQHESGPFQGRICGNTEAFGAFYSLDELVQRVGSMLRYETYHAEMRFPYPEDENVARWVREVGEPLGIVKKGVGIADPLLLPENWRERMVSEKRMKVRL